VEKHTFSWAPKIVFKVHRKGMKEKCKKKRQISKASKKEFKSTEKTKM
jgi:hypothetical protein